MSSKQEKLFVAGLALFFLFGAVTILTVGSFLPKWASMKNSTADGNVSFSLWTREECFGQICVVKHMTVQSRTEDCWLDEDTGREKCETFTKTKLKTTRKCVDANFCNSTWVAGDDLENTPSILIVAKAFETPAIFFGLVCLVLYIVKIVHFIKRPTANRLHLKAAYLTFGAIAGVSSLLGVILFWSMLEDDRYEQHFAPYLNLTAGIVLFLFGFGGYLRWRDRTAGNVFDDDMSICESQINDIKLKDRDAILNRQTSQTSAKGAVSQV